MDSPNDTNRSDKRKQSLYFPVEMLREIQIEANRQDRSLSWIVQQAWRLARGEIRRFPSVNDAADAGTHEPEEFSVNDAVDADTHEPEE